jgi:hypothetical protein
VKCGRGAVLARGFLHCREPRARLPDTSLWSSWASLQAEDLLNVEGVGPKTLERLKPFFATSVTSAINAIENPLIFDETWIGDRRKLLEGMDWLVRLVRFRY